MAIRLDGLNPFTQEPCKLYCRASIVSCTKFQTVVSFESFADTPNVVNPNIAPMYRRTYMFETDLALQQNNPVEYSYLLLQREVEAKPELYTEFANAEWNASPLQY